MQSLLHSNQKESIVDKLYYSPVPQKQYENANQHVEMMKNCKLVIETINAHRA